jgi:hypothetical protein
MNIDEFLAGPTQLRQALAGMSREQLIARPIPGKWSALEVVCHLADFEIVGADRIKRVIVENKPVLFGGDEKAFAARLAYHERDAGEEISLMELLRKQVARILKTLRSEDFKRLGVHTERGLMTLEELVEGRIGHFRHHLPFIADKRAAIGV